MNKITFEEKLKIVKENQEGYGQIYLSQKYGIPRDLIRSWINSYEILGEEGLKKWIVPKKVDTKNKKSILICTPSPSQMVKAYCWLNEVA